MGIVLEVMEEIFEGQDRLIAEVALEIVDLSELPPEMECTYSLSGAETVSFGDIDSDAWGLLKTKSGAVIEFV